VRRFYRTSLIFTKESWRLECLGFVKKHFKKIHFLVVSRYLISPLPPGEKPHIGDYFHFEITFGKRGVCANYIVEIEEESLGFPKNIYIMGFFMLYFFRETDIS
jgi:hypothetical protein